jgi:hypothetical protein
MLESMQTEKPCQGWALTQPSYSLCWKTLAVCKASTRLGVLPMQGCTQGGESESKTAQPLPQLADTILLLASSAEQA